MKPGFYHVTATHPKLEDVAFIDAKSRVYLHDSKKSETLIELERRHRTFHVERLVPPLALYRAMCDLVDEVIRLEREGDEHLRSVLKAHLDRYHRAVAEEESG